MYFRTALSLIIRHHHYHETGPEVRYKGFCLFGKQRAVKITHPREEKGSTSVEHGLKARRFNIYVFLCDLSAMPDAIACCPDIHHGKRRLCHHISAASGVTNNGLMKPESVPETTEIEQSDAAPTAGH